MNGLRKVGKSKNKDKEFESEEELDFCQEIDDAVEEKEDSTNKPSGKKDSDKKIIPDSKLSDQKLKVKEIEKKLSKNNLNALKEDKLELESELQKENSKQPIEIKFNEDVILNFADVDILEQIDSQSASSFSEVDDIYNRNEEKNLRTVYIRNVDSDASPEELAEHFKACGDINRVSILIDKYTGMPKGFAFIEFSSREAKENARNNLNDSVFKERQIKVEDKKLNFPDIYGQNTKKFKRPIFRTEHAVRGVNTFYGPIKGKYTPQRNFKPY